MKHNLYKTTPQRVGRYDISYRPGPENTYTPWCVHTLDGTLVSKWETRGKARAAVKGYILTAEKREFKASSSHKLDRKQMEEAGFDASFYARYPFVSWRRRS